MYIVGRIIYEPKMEEIARKWRILHNEEHHDMCS
jgi:hypothetical protein